MLQNNRLKQLKLRRPPADSIKDCSSEPDDVIFQRWDDLFCGHQTAIKETCRKTEFGAENAKQCCPSTSACDDFRPTEHKIEDNCRVVLIDVKNDEEHVKMLQRPEECITVIDEEDIAESRSTSCVSRIYMHGHKPLRFEMRRNERFKRILLEAADQFHIPFNDVCFFHNVQYIDFRCTPQELDLPDYFILEARKVGTTEVPVVENVDRLELYFQTNALRSNKIKLIVNKEEKFSSIKAKLTKLLDGIGSCSRSQIKLLFDGTLIDNGCTPMDLDLEPEDCIDVLLP